MRSVKIGIFILLCIALITGCKHKNTKIKGVSSSNSVEELIVRQIEEEEGKDTEENNETEENKSTEEEVYETVQEESPTVEMPEETDISNDAADNTVEEETAGAEPEGKTTVDYDLTAMSSDMVYATVYQMMILPEDYEGKTFRMKGSFYATYYEPTQSYYYYCIIQDATACCAQGLEFVWGDGSHKYPDEYPEEYTDVVVEGTFETYREEGDENLYCRLTDAVLTF